MGWKVNYHAYAFRRVIRNNLSVGHKDERSAEFNDERILRLKKEECWIGPQNCTAVDSFFQPLYIGGCTADDRSIELGDLLYGEFAGSNIDDVIDLEWVHDFGCWWTHSIHVEPCQPPKSGHVAWLISGEKACPLEDSGGTHGWIQTMGKVFGQINMEGGNKKLDTKTGPSNSAWWEILRDECHGKHNSRGLKNLAHFNLEESRRILKEALTTKISKRGREHRQLLHDDMKIGFIGTKNDDGLKPRFKQVVAKSRNACAVCGVTAGLKLCSRCKSVAFCSREHMEQFWPQHKKECKKKSKDR